MTKEAELIRAYYCSVGPKLTVDSLTVEFRIDGEVFIHQLPNKGWTYQTLALAFMGFIEISPTDFHGGEFIFNEKVVPVVWDDNQSQYMIDRDALVVGVDKLKNVDWFSPGSVWNSDGSQGIGGINFDPGTGNRGKVSAGGEDE